MLGGRAALAATQSCGLHLLTGLAGLILTIIQHDAAPLQCAAATSTVLLAHLHAVLQASEAVFIAAGAAVLTRIRSLRLHHLCLRSVRCCLCLSLGDQSSAAAGDSSGASSEQNAAHRANVGEGHAG